MKLLANIVRFGVILLLIDYISSNQFISVFVQKCYGTCNQKYCNLSMACRPLNRTSKRVTWEFYIHPGVKLEAPIDIEVIAYKKFRTVYHQHMVKLKIELCAQLNQMDHPLLKYVLYEKVYGNMLDPCPLIGHRYVEPYVITPTLVPLVPVGEWRLDFVISKNINNSEEFLASWSDFYEVKPTSAVEF